MRPSGGSFTLLKSELMTAGLAKTERGRVSQADDPMTPRYEFRRLAIEV